MTARKSVKEIFPVPSLSTSPIIFLISSFFGSNPRALIATWKKNYKMSEQRWSFLTHVDCDPCLSPYTLSSLTSMNPEPSVSNSSNASLISCFCSSVSSGLGAVFLRGGGTGPCRDGLLALVAWWRTQKGSQKKNQLLSSINSKSNIYDDIWEISWGEILFSVTWRKKTQK